MKITCLISGLIAVSCVLSAAAEAQTNLAMQSPPPPSAGLVNDWLRTESDAFQKWDAGGQVRLRYESRQNMAVTGRAGAVDFGNNGVDNDNDYLLTREKIHLGYSPVDWLTLFAEGRHSSESGDERTPSPDADTMDLHQAFVKLGNGRDFPVTAKVGRQEMIYGDERLIGASDWSNVQRVFDAAKLRYENDTLWVDAFVGRVVLVRDHYFNEANDYDFFSGLYASTRKLIPVQETQVYFLARNVGQGSPTAIGPGLPPYLTGASPRDIYTLGFRIKSLPGSVGSWDYEAEAAGQFGEFQAAAGAPRLDQQAIAAHVAGGYTWTNVWGTPRAGVEYNYSSGDSNPADSKHETFDNLFPTNHKFYGYMDLFSWQNLHDARLATSLKPLTKLTLTLDYHAFWLADTHDFFYQVNGAPRTTGGYGINPGAGSFVGTEIDFVANYAIKPWAGLQAGYGHFFTGDYVNNSLAATGGAVDADWFYAQFILNF